MGEKVEKIKPYGTKGGKKSEQVRDMFDAIAPSYDFMNRAMTSGVDKTWRKKAVDMIVADESSKILDIATGTGDFAIFLAEKIPDATVTGIDLSEKMLEIAKRKVQNKGLEKRISLLKGDGTQLPFPDKSFDAVTIAYGIRNFEDIEKGYREMFRVMQPDAVLTVVELATPVNPLALTLYRLYTRYIIPFVGRFISKDHKAYTYLPESIAAVPQREAMCRIMERVGFRDVSYKPMTFGTCIIYRGRRQTTN